MHIIPHLQEFTLCHYIFSADATRKLCMFTGFLVFFNVFSVLAFIVVLSQCCCEFFPMHTLAVWVRVYLIIYYCICPRSLHFSLSLALSAVFYTPFILQVYLKVHIYLMWRLSAVSVAFTFLFWNLTQTRSDTATHTLAETEREKSKKVRGWGFVYALPCCTACILHSIYTHAYSLHTCNV